MAGCKGKVMTVEGLIDPTQVGVTLTHEHLYLKVPSFFTKPSDKDGQDHVHAPIEMKNLGWIRQNPYSNWPNLSLYGENEAVMEELIYFKENGGHTIVENTSIGIYRDLPTLKHMSQSTGVNIVCGTGFYVDAAQTESIRNYSEEKMADQIRADILDGVEGIKCGIIGEIGTTWPITDFERRSLRSSAIVQQELGAPIIIHPGRDSRCPGEAMRYILEAGGKAEHTVMSHLDRTFFDKESLLEFAEIGSILEYDLFGIETSHYQLKESIDMPSDAQRIQVIKTLVDEGLEDRIVIAHDIHTKHRLTKYGGHGYSHILVNIVPKMLNRGISQAQVDKFLKTNPRRWLQFTK